MRRELIVIATGAVLAGGAAAPALAGSAHPSHPAHSAHLSHPAKAKVFKSTVKPNKNVKPGTTLVLTSSKAMKNTTYSCVLIVEKGSSYGADINSVTTVKSNKSGHVRCAQKYEPYQTTYNMTLNCPPTAKEKKEGYSCAVSLADQATQGQKSATVAKFTARK